VLNSDLSISDRFLGKTEILKIVGFSAATLWREVHVGRFPAPVHISANRVGFLESEVKAWMADRIGRKRRSHAPLTDRPDEDRSQGGCDVV